MLPLAHPSQGSQFIWFLTVINCLTWLHLPSPLQQAWSNLYTESGQTPNLEPIKDFGILLRNEIHMVKNNTDSTKHNWTEDIMQYDSRATKRETETFGAMKWQGHDHVYTVYVCVCVSMYMYVYSKCTWLSVSFYCIAYSINMFLC